VKDLESSAPPPTSTSTSTSTPTTTSTRDRAARARVRCLSTLEHARKDDAMLGTKNDALLASLSGAGFRPTRTEQGVAVSLEGAFEGAALSQNGKKKLADLGRVAREEKVGVELVLHDATDPNARDAANDKARADAAAEALVQAGADRASLKVELAGAKLPLFDPQDAAHRARNARLDVIFVR
jgi:outer membrane protein OmpA-like peptidoglycan-associated protein